MAIFGKDSTPQRAAPSRAESSSQQRLSYVGPGLRFDGKLSGSEDVVIEGHVLGEIDLGSSLRIGSKARVEARVHAKNVIVEGKLDGDISAEERVELITSAQVTGNIRCPKIIVAEGARFHGSVDMNAPGEVGRKGKPADKTTTEEQVHAANRS